MTENHVKEVLSTCFITAMASYCGHKITSDGNPDYGTDLVLKEVITRNLTGKPRLSQSGRYVTLQVKATTEHKVNRKTSGIIKYALENKTYNDLVSRKQNQTRQILVLFILPDDKAEWVRHTSDELITKKHAYWFDIPDTATHVEDNNSRTTISIPEENQLCFSSFGELFEIIRPSTSTQTTP